MGPAHGLDAQRSWVEVFIGPRSSRDSFIASSPCPGFGEKNCSSLLATPSNSLASAGGSRLTAMFGQIDAYSALSLSQLSRPGSVSAKIALSRTFRLAHAAVDALVGMDDEHVLAFVEAVDRTHLHAVHVFALDAVVGDDEGHGADLCHGRSGR